MEMYKPPNLEKIIGENMEDSQWKPWKKSPKDFGLSKRDYLLLLNRYAKRALDNGLLKNSRDIFELADVLMSRAKELNPREDIVANSYESVKMLYSTGISGIFTLAEVIHSTNDYSLLNEVILNEKIDLLYDLKKEDVETLEKLLSKSKNPIKHTLLSVAHLTADEEIGKRKRMAIKGFPHYLNALKYKDGLKALQKALYNFAEDVKQSNRFYSYLALRSIVNIYKKNPEFALNPRELISLEDFDLEYSEVWNKTTALKIAAIQSAILLALAAATSGEYAHTCEWDSSGVHETYYYYDYTDFAFVFTTYFALPLGFFIDRIASYLLNSMNPAKKIEKYMKKKKVWGGKMVEIERYLSNFLKGIPLNVEQMCESDKLNLKNILEKQASHVFDNYFQRLVKDMHDFINNAEQVVGNRKGFVDYLSKKPSLDMIIFTLSGEEGIFYVDNSKRERFVHPFLRKEDVERLKSYAKKELSGRDYEIALVYLKSLKPVV